MNRQTGRERFLDRYDPQDPDLYLRKDRKRFVILGVCLMLFVVGGAVIAGTVLLVLYVERAGISPLVYFFCFFMGVAVIGIGWYTLGAKPTGYVIDRRSRELIRVRGFLRLRMKDRRSLEGLVLRIRPITITYNHSPMTTYEVGFADDPWTEFILIDSFMDEDQARELVQEVTSFLEGS